MSSRRCRIPTLLILLLAVVAGRPAHAGLDPALAALLPEDARIVVAAPSLAGVDAAVAQLVERLGLPTCKSDPISHFFEASPEGLLGAADPQAPLAVALGLPPLGTDAAYTHTAVFRTTLAPAELETALAALDPAGPAGHVGPDGWVIVTTDPGYAPGHGDAALLADPPPGDAFVRIDIGGLLGDYGPMIAMGLGALEAAAAAPRDGEDAAAGPQVSPEQIKTMRTFAEALIASLLRFDMGLGIRRDEAVLVTRLDVAPDSPLTPGPQPDFARARHLTRYLDHDADLTSVGAMDMARLLEVYLPFIRSTLRNDAADAGAGAREMAAWLERYYEIVGGFDDPYASVVEFDEAGIRMLGLAESDDAAAQAERMAGLLDDLPDGSGGLSLERVRVRPLAGVNPLVWSLAVTSDADADPLGYGKGMAQATPWGNLDPRLAPGLIPAYISMAVRGDLLLFACGDAPDALGDLLSRLDADDGHEDTRIDCVARRGVAGTRQVVIGDLAPYLAWIAALLPEDAPDLAAALDPDQSLRLLLSSSTSDTRYTSYTELDMEVLDAVGRMLGMLDGGSCD